MIITMFSAPKLRKHNQITISRYYFDDRIGIQDNNRRSFGTDIETNTLIVRSLLVATKGWPADERLIA